MEHDRAQDVWPIYTDTNYLKKLNFLHSYKFNVSLTINANISLFWPISQWLLIIMPPTTHTIPYLTSNINTNILWFAQIHSLSILYSFNLFSHYFQLIERSNHLCVWPAVKEERIKISQGKEYTCIELKEKGKISVLFSFLKELAMDTSHSKDKWTSQYQLNEVIHLTAGKNDESHTM